MRPAVLALMTALALALGGWRASSAPAPDPLEPAPAGPLVRVVDRPRGGDQLLLVDPATLRRVSGPVGTFRDGFAPAFSPDRRVFAYADGLASRARIQLLDVAGWRSLGVVELGGPGQAQIFWPQQDRLLAVAGLSSRRKQVMVVDTAGWRVVSRHRWRGDVVASAPSRRGIAVLVAPARRIGAARLLHVDVEGRRRWIRLARIRAGFEQSMRRDRPAASLHPGLAVDPDGDRAYVVAAGGPLVADVALASGRVAYHRLRGRSNRATAAKGGGASWWRDALWLGDGRIAVVGDDRPAPRPGRRPAPPIRPFGLRLIDVSRWRLSTLHPRAMQMHVAGNRLLASGTTWDAGFKHSSSTGLLAYDTRGRRAFRRFRGADVSVLGAHGRLAYVWVRPTRILHVLDLASGSTLRKSRVPPHRLPFLFTPVGR